jgi:hypothetical protein
MSKVYVVTRGERSDYGIVCIMSTRELAESYCENAPYQCEIDEYEVDERAEFVSWKVFTAWINTTDGKILLGNGVSKMVSPYLHGRVVSEWVGRIVVESYISKEHAEKLAVEARRRYLRDGGV